MSVITVEGVADNGERTVLAYPASLDDAHSFLMRYVSRENAGNWNLIEIVQHDTRVLDWWERDNEGEDTSL